MIRRVTVLGFLAFSGFMTLGCSDGSIESPVEPQFAKGGKPAAPQFAITGFNVKKFQDGLTHPVSDHDGIVAAVAAYAVENAVRDDFFGCPETDRVCNRITMTFEGILETFVFYVAHNAGQLYYSTDPFLVDRTLAGNWWELAMPSLPMDEVVDELVVYWQGQRETGYGSVDWTLMPDMDVLEEEDQFVFTCSYSTISDGKHCGRGAFMNYENGSASYRGPDSDRRAFIVLDEVELVTLGGSSKPKRKPSPSPTYITFDAQAFNVGTSFSETPDYSHPDILQASVAANFRPMLIEPGEDGLKSFFPSGSRGADPDHPIKPGIEKESSRIGPLNVEGCHAVKMVGVYVYDADAVDVVWDPAKDTGLAASSIWINHIPTNPTGSSWGRGSCPSG